MTTSLQTHNGPGARSAKNRTRAVTPITLQEDQLSNHPIPDLCTFKELCPQGHVRVRCTDVAGHDGEHMLHQACACPIRREPVGNVSNDEAAALGVYVDIEVDADGDQHFTVRMDDGPITFDGLDSLIDLLVSVRDFERQRRVYADVEKFIDSAPADFTVQDLARAAEAVEDSSAFLRLAFEQLGDQARGGGTDA